MREEQTFFVVLRSHLVISGLPPIQYLGVPPNGAQGTMQCWEPNLVVGTKPRASTCKIRALFLDK